MRVHHKLSKLRTALQAERDAHKTIAFVPTMGYLHQGHASLVRAAHRAADVVVLSIYVNPTQFGPGEDLDSYPRDMEHDLEICIAEAVDHLFVPDTDTMYPTGFDTVVRVDGLTTGLCGAHRPGHFQGVTTVVAKLLNMVQPHVAVFGEKDYQQLVVVRKMVADLNMPVEILGAPTFREPDGLALSSRNKYLSAEERQKAPRLYAALCETKRLVRGGDRDAGALRSRILAQLHDAGFVPDYVEFVDAATLAPVDVIDREVRLAAAARLGSTRLIDNITVGPDTPP